MRRNRFLRFPKPAWALEKRSVPVEARGLADEAVKLYGRRKLIWRVNLSLVGVLVVSQVALKFVIPEFPAAEYLAVELGLIEAASLLVTRRFLGKEEELREEFQKCIAESTSDQGWPEHDRG